MDTEINYVSITGELYAGDVYNRCLLLRFTLFGDIALAMLQMMGHSATLPGAFPAVDVPVALRRFYSHYRLHHHWSLMSLR